MMVRSQTLHKSKLGNALISLSWQVSVSLPRVMTDNSESYFSSLYIFFLLIYSFFFTILPNCFILSVEVYQLQKYLAAIRQPKYIFMRNNSYFATVATCWLLSMGVGTTTSGRMAWGRMTTSGKLRGGTSASGGMIARRRRNSLPGL